MPPKRKAAAEGGGAKKKTKGDKFGGMKKDEFVKAAGPVKGVVTLPGAEGKTVEFECAAGTLGASNVGWKGNGRFTVTVEVDGKPYEVTANFNLNATIVSAKGPDAAQNGEASGDDKEEKADDKEEKEEKADEE
ncbi:hypothetical protein BT69DRAFT_1315784 [Atractiella rhizophila]|nr:hypothetical protein BT69DRAFT_1315784 [Atractiella rhizophila]